MPEGRIEADYCLCSTHRYDDGVAPHAGAWIETRQGSARTRNDAVAPHAGAWLETRPKTMAATPGACRAPCGRMDCSRSEQAALVYLADV